MIIIPSNQKWNFWMNLLIIPLKEMKQIFSISSLINPEFPSSSSILDELGQLQNHSLFDEFEEAISNDCDDSLNTPRTPVDESQPSVQPINTITASKRWQLILAHTDAATPKEADLYSCLLNYLKSVHHKTETFILLLFNIFGYERLTNSEFVYFLSNAMNINYSNLKRSLSRWMKNDLMERRGKAPLSTKVRQKIYDTWLGKSIPSTDNRK